MIRRPLFVLVNLAFAYAAAASDSQNLTTNRVYATQITTDNASSLIRSGPDAIGGINDWFISNGTLCGIISDISHEGDFSASGGSLVDLGFCGRADDYFSFTHDLLQGSRWQPLDGKAIRVEQSDHQASIIVTGERDGVQIETRYNLNKDQPTQLHISKRLRTRKDQTNKNDFSLFSALIFNYHSLEPFVFSSNNLRNSNGFQNEDFATRGESAISVAARNADTIITPSPPTAEHGISYGWQLVSAERVSASDRYPVPRFALADDSSNAFLILSDTFYLGDGNKIRWLQLPQLLLLSLGDDTLETEEIIYVGRRGDVASITDQIFDDQPTVSGRVNESNVALHITLMDGTPVTHVRPDQQGRFHVRLPTGDYTLHAKGTAYRQHKQTVTVAQSDVDLGQIALPPPARLSLPNGAAMRLVFLGVNDTPDPNFADTLTGSSVMDDDGERFPDPVNQVFLAGVAGDLSSVELAPGEYRVYATRGPEYSLESTQINIKPESQNTLSIKTPSRAINTPHYIASDLHVHSGLSFDSTLAEMERVRTFVAEHGEVMVSSEHDVPVDYAPLIKAMGVDDTITSIAAAEVTSLLPTKLNPYTSGHANFFPFYPKPHEYRRGMVNHENRRWRDIIHDIKHHQPDVVVQLNHPRLNLKLSNQELPNNWEESIDNGQFLDHMGSAGHPYNPHQPLHEHPNSVLIEKDKATGVRDLDFDLIEIINPGGEYHHDRIKAVRRDWLSLLNQGEKIVGTANSDSHHSSFQVAVPRTMVGVSDDRISKFNQTEFLQSLKGGNAYGTTGPMLTITLGGKQMGETFTGERGQLSLTVFSADWIPVDKIKIQINGDTIDEYELTPSSSHQLLIPISFNKDSFVTVEVSGPATNDYQTIYPGLSPYAFSNPIYVDYDGDGQWSAPGL